MSVCECVCTEHLTFPQWPPLVNMNINEQHERIEKKFAAHDLQQEGLLICAPLINVWCI